jgi:nucleotide-binding universal stress UspA family protein
MSWKPIVVGVDQSPQAAAAAALSWTLAQATGAECYFVHGTRAMVTSSAAVEFVADVEALLEQQVEAARIGVAAALERVLPPEALRRLEVRLGRGAAVVTQAAREHQAGLIVLGGKHHSALGRWMGGSTAHHVLRATDIPLLVTGERPHPIRRILVAADLSYAAQPTLEAAFRLARAVGADVRVLHVIEPLPVLAEMPLVFDQEGFYREAEQRFARHLELLLAGSPAEAVTRQGFATETIAREAQDWQADLVALGSHGKGWMDRLLLGSTTERLLDQLPASLLVVPVRAPPSEGAASPRSEPAATGSQPE